MSTDTRGRKGAETAGLAALREKLVEEGNEYEHIKKVKIHTRTDKEHDAVAKLSWGGELVEFVDERKIGAVLNDPDFKRAIQIVKDKASKRKSLYKERGLYGVYADGFGKGMSSTTFKKSGLFDIVEDLYGRYDTYYVIPMFLSHWDEINEAYSKK